MKPSKLRELEEKLPAIERPATIKGIAEATGISAVTVSKHLGVLQAQGKVKMKLLGATIVVL